MGFTSSSVLLSTAILKMICHDEFFSFLIEYLGRAPRAWEQSGVTIANGEEMVGPRRMMSRGWWIDCDAVLSNFFWERIKLK